MTCLFPQISVKRNGCNVSRMPLKTRANTPAKNFLPRAINGCDSPPQHPHAGSTGSDPGPPLRELPLGPPQAGWQVVLPWLHSASFSCVRTCLSACFSAPPPHLKQQTAD